jgi:hypothetical protein
MRHQLLLYLNCVEKVTSVLGGVIISAPILKSTSFLARLPMSPLQPPLSLKTP